MRKSILFALVIIVLSSCQEADIKTELNDQVPVEAAVNEVLKFSDIIGDTLRYEMGEPVFDIVISSDSTLYWKSLNPKYGTEAHEKITVLPISEHENMISYVESNDVGVCWYNDFENEISTVSVFIGPNMMTFSGTVKRKYEKE